MMRGILNNRYPRIGGPPFPHRCSRAQTAMFGGNCPIIMFRFVFRDAVHSVAKYLVLRVYHSFHEKVPSLKLIILYGMMWDA